MHHLRTLALYGIEHDLNELTEEPEQKNILSPDEEDDRGPIDNSRSSKALSDERDDSSDREEGFWFPRR